MRNPQNQEVVVQYALGLSAGIIVRRSTAKFFHPHSTLDGRRNADLGIRAPIAALSYLTSELASTR